MSRNSNIRLRVTEAQYEAIKRSASKMGLSIADYARVLFGLPLTHKQGKYGRKTKTASTLKRYAQRSK